MEKSKLLKKVVIVVIILLLIFFAILIRKMTVINKLINASEEYASKTNYIKISSYVQRDKIMITKSYNNNDDFLEQEEYYEIKNNQKAMITSYKKGNDTLKVIQSGENKEVMSELNGKKSTIWTMYSVYGNLNFKDYIVALLKTDISTDEVDNKECYLIKLENDALVWVDKETGLDVRFSNGAGITEVVYEFDEVTDADIVKPEI